VTKPAKAFPREGILNLLTGESDRGCALVAGEALNELLGSMLERLFVEGKAGRELLDGGNAPLGTFSSRIKACFALGLTTSDEHHDLDAIRKVRNSAAHFGEGNLFSFSNEHTVEQCRVLRTMSPPYMKKIEARMGVRGQFIGRVVALHIGIGNRRERVRRSETPAPTLVFAVTSRSGGVASTAWLEARDEEDATAKATERQPGCKVTKVERSA